MPADFLIDVRAGVVFTKGVGVLRREDVLELQERLVAHPDFRPHFSQLVDSRDVSQVELSVEDLSELTAGTAFNSTSKRAMLVPSDVQFGISRIYQTYSELKGHTGFRVFRDTQKAFDYLGIDGVPPAEAFTRLVSPSRID